MRRTRASGAPSGLSHRPLLRPAKTLLSATNILLAKLGLQLRPVCKTLLAANGDVLYSDVAPLANYSPWLADAEFKKTYEMIRSYTMVDFYRCYELWQLVAQVSKLESGDIIEIGVWRGGTGALIAKRAQMNAGCTVYLCDTFKGVVKAGPRDTYYVGGEHADTSQDAVERLLNGLSLNKVQILAGVFPDETGPTVADRKFRLCHIDVDVYASGKDILDWVYDRMVPGGIIIFDDYGFDVCSGITDLVEEQSGKAGRLTIYNLNGHGIVVKLGDPGSSNGNCLL